jgi:hypothetical protein
MTEEVSKVAYVLERVACKIKSTGRIGKVFGILKPCVDFYLQ